MLSAATVWREAIAWSEGVPHKISPTLFDVRPAAFQVVVGGFLLFLTDILIGSA